MKILHVIPYFATSFGGPVVALQNMREAAAQQGILTDVVTVNNVAGRGEICADNGGLHRPSFGSVHGFSSPLLKGWFYSPEMERWLSERVGDYDLLHLHVPFTYPVWCAARVAQKLAKPYLISTHGVLDPWSLGYKRWKKKPYLRWVETPNIIGASVIHVTSLMEAEGFKALGLSVPIRVLPLSAIAPAQSNPADTGPLNILSVARIHPVKNFPILFEACAKVLKLGVNLRLWLAGNGDEEYVAQLKYAVQGLGISEYVNWCGHVSGKEKEELFSKAHLFVLMSQHENFGLAIAEALAAGIPAIVSDQVGIATDIQAYGAGIVLPVGDVDGVVSAILKLSNSGTRAIYVKNARKLAVENYAPSTFSRGLASMYEFALSQGPVVNAR